ncbi:MAG: non-canonical purine NTP pyrophosphatase [Erysipelothrix sp.]|nr:non-canonical purine NTP pyrophosphatase [Erysipelothrix sp.]
MKILIATHNVNKAKEFKELLGSSYEVYTLKDVGYTQEIVEDATTYIGNATLKVDALKDKFKDYIIISDDSGFSIKALNFEPGVFSARYLGEDTPYIIKNQKILDLMKNENDRQATFMCAMTLYYQGHYFQTQQVVYGQVAKEILGDGGFGYDPIFIPEGSTKSYAEDYSAKQKSSHRAKALREIIRYVQYLEN